MEESDEIKNVPGQRTVLSLSGGGVKGIFSLHVLMAIQINSPHKKISDLFSLIVGTSVGAFVAAFISFGILDDPNVDCVKLMHDNLADLFRNQNSDGPLLSPKYDGVGKRAVLRRIFGYRKLSEAQTPLVITCCDAMTGKPVILKSFDPKHANISIVEALDATSAAPVYFPPVIIQGKALVDGGVLMNNPILVTYMMAASLFESKDFRMLALVNRNQTKVVQNDVQPSHISQLGAVAWLTGGHNHVDLFELIMGCSNTIPTQLMSLIMGDNFMQINANIEGSLDDRSSTFINQLAAVSRETWSREGTGILSFLNLTSKFGTTFSADM